MSVIIHRLEGEFTNIWACTAIICVLLFYMYHRYTDVLVAKEHQSDALQELVLYLDLADTARFSWMSVGRRSTATSVIP